MKPGKSCRPPFANHLESFLAKTMPCHIMEYFYATRINSMKMDTHIKKNIKKERTKREENRDNE